MVKPGVHLHLELCDFRFGAERPRRVEPLLGWQRGKFAALAQDLETQMFDDLRLLPALSLLDPRNPLGPALRARSQTRLLWRGTAGWSKTPYCLFRQGVAHGGTASSSKSCKYGERTNKQQSCGARNTRKSLVGLTRPPERYRNKLLIVCRMPKAVPCIRGWHRALVKEHRSSLQFA